MALRPLSRPYQCVFGVPGIDHVDPRIFRLTYFARCMDCTFCHDACCMVGADVEKARADEILKHRAELEEYTGWGREWWFRTDPSDVGWKDEPEYPGGAYTRTQVVDLPAGRSPHNESGCVFLDPAGRGCLLHRFALDRGIDVHTIKPMVCLLFPLSFDKGILEPAYEFNHKGELICVGPGETLYRSARDDVRWYFGPEMVAELDRIEAEEAAPATGSGTIPLRVCSS
jgi:Fe-S-cluster containining protein